MKQIKLTKNKYALVDDEDYDFLNQWKWHYHSMGYASRRKWIKGQNRQESILMHRFLMNTPVGMDTDHINRNKLDNRRSNLQICTKGLNHQRAKLQSNNTTGYKGIVWYKPTNRWRVAIKFNKKGIHLGYFKELTEAISAYNNKALELFGSMAVLN